MKPPEIKKIDFSQFHPLDHSVWQCRGYPGGWRRHFSHRWQFQWHGWLRMQTLCRIGRHDWVQWYRGGDGTPAGITCRDCYKDKEEHER